MAEGNDYFALMKDVLCLEKGALVDFARNIGMLDNQLTGTVRTISKTVREHIDTVLEEAADETEEITRLQEQISTFKLDEDRGPTGSQDVNVNPAQSLGLETVAEGVQAGLSLEKDPIHTSTPSLNLNKFPGVTIGGRDEGSIMDGGKLFFKGLPKIKGVIGKGLSYNSLVRQVNLLSKDHPTCDVIEAVIQAVDSALSLRSLLDSKPNIDLQSVLSMIKSSAKESNTTTQFIKLTNAVQSQDEDALSFLIRVMNLKAKILCSFEEGDVVYTEKQVTSVFLKALENGIRNDSIRSKLRIFLKPDIRDEELMEKLSEITTEENDRARKIQKNAKSQIRSIEAEKDELNSLRESVKELTVEVKALKTERGKNEPRNRFRPGCRSCREKGWGSSCRHCFRCGNIGHLSRDCDLNDQGLVLIGDHQ